MLRPGFELASLKFALPRGALIQDHATDWATGKKFAHPVDGGSDEGDVDDGEAGEGARLDLADAAVDDRDRQRRRKRLRRQLRNRRDVSKRDRRLRRLDRQVRLEGRCRQSQRFDVVDGDVIDDVERFRIDGDDAWPRHFQIEATWAEKIPK